MDRCDVMVIIEVGDEKLPCLRECRMRRRIGVNFARSETVEAEAGVRVEDFAMVKETEEDIESKVTTALCYIRLFRMWLELLFKPSSLKKNETCRQKSQSVPSEFAFGKSIERLTTPTGVLS